MIVLHGFVDTVENRSYKAGDEFIVGPNTTKERIASLASYDNAASKPLIGFPVEAVKVEQPSEEVETEEVETEEVENEEEMTVAEIKELLTERGIEFKARATKAELIELLGE